jgi:hypothetical protein
MSEATSSITTSNQHSGLTFFPSELLLCGQEWHLHGATSIRLFAISHSGAGWWIKYGADDGQQ